MRTLTFGFVTQSTIGSDMVLKNDQNRQNYVDKSYTKKEHGVCLQNLKKNFLHISTSQKLSKKLIEYKLFVIYGKVLTVVRLYLPVTDVTS